MAFHRPEVILDIESLKRFYTSSSYCFSSLVYLLVRTVNASTSALSLESLWIRIMFCCEGKNWCHLVFMPRMCRSWRVSLVSERLPSKLQLRACLQFHTPAMEESLCVGLKYLDPCVFGQMHRITLKRLWDLVKTNKSIKFNLQNLDFMGLVKAWSVPLHLWVMLSSASGKNPIFFCCYLCHNACVKKEMRA